VTVPYVVIIILEVALIVKLSGLCWAQYKEKGLTVKEMMTDAVER
jgi:hypothetical protein